jgi:hypothetical protein
MPFAWLAATESFLSPLLKHAPQAHQHPDTSIEYVLLPLVGMSEACCSAKVRHLDTFFVVDAD